MKPSGDCNRCGQPAFAVLKIEASADGKRLVLTQDASDYALCPVCMLNLARWIKTVPRPMRLSAGE